MKMRKYCGIRTDKEIEHARPDILTLNKKERSCVLVDITCPFDTSVLQKEWEKIEKYQDLKIEIKRIWKRMEVSCNCTYSYWSTWNSA